MGYLFLGPEKGEMACGEFGEGKMSSPRQIFAYLKNYFDKRNIVKKETLSMANSNLKLVKKKLKMRTFMERG